MKKRSRKETENKYREGPSDSTSPSSLVALFFNVFFFLFSLKNNVLKWHGTIRWPDGHDIVLRCVVESKKETWNQRGKDEKSWKKTDKMRKKDSTERESESESGGKRLRVVRNRFVEKRRWLWGGEGRYEPHSRPEPRQRNAVALWSRTIKNPDASTGPLPRPFACSLTLLTRLFASHCSLHLRTPMRSLICLLAHFTHSLARGKVDD